MIVEIFFVYLLFLHDRCDTFSDGILFSHETILRWPFLDYVTLGWLYSITIINIIIIIADSMDNSRGIYI